MKKSIYYTDCISPHLLLYTHEKDNIESRVVYISEKFYKDSKGKADELFERISLVFNLTSELSLEDIKQYGLRLGKKK